MTTLTKSPMDPLTRPARDFWHGVLAAGGSTTVPRWTLDPVPGVADHETPISRQTLVAIRRLAYDLGVPLRTVLLAAHAKVLAALSGEHDVVVGYVADPVVGPLPCRLSTEPASWREMVQQTRRTESALRAYAGFPVDDLRRELALAGPAFETVFNLAGAADVSRDAVLDVSFPERDGGRVLRLRYRTDVLDASCAARIAGYHLTALKQIMADPDAEHEGRPADPGAGRPRRAARRRQARRAEAAPAAVSSEGFEELGASGCASRTPQPALTLDGRKETDMSLGHPEGTYSSTAWPASQPICMHHELRYTLEVPGLMLFACLTAPTTGGAEPWQAGDLPLVENIRTAHSYEPYTGAGEVVVGMAADPVRLAEGDPGDGSPR